jgi:hypothetical protein
MTPAFVAEDEFRWVYSAINDELPSDLQVNFRPYATIIKPYLEVDFSRA